MQNFSTKIESNPEVLTDRCSESKELRDTFYSNSKKGNIYHVILNQNGLLWKRDSSTGEYKKDLLVNISDIIGGRCVWIQKSAGIGAVSACGACTPSIMEKKKSQIEETEDAYLYVFAYVLKKSMRKAARRERTVITLRFRSYDNQEDNMREAERWYKALKTHRSNQIIHSNNYTADTSQNAQETVLNRLLILLNPISGSGRAREVFNQHVITILNEAELPYDLYITKHSNYAYNFVRQKKLSSWSGIIAIGGDGLFHEILNGLLKRKDWDLVTKNIALGVVPCGSGNGLARSIAYYFKEPYEPKPILGATLTAVGGKSSLMDVVEIEQHNNIMYSFLSVGWGLISDIDIESERLRSLGYQRFTIWTLHRLINLRTYRGKISYLRKTNAEQQNTADTTANKTISEHSTNRNTFPRKQETSNKYSTDFEDVISLETAANQSYRSRCNSLLSSGSKVSAYYSIAESIYHSVAGNSDCFDTDMHNSESSEFSQGPRFGELHDNPLPPLQEPLPATWLVEDGEFVMIHAVYQTHLGSDCFFSPDSKLNDGIIYLVIIRGGISRSQLFTFLVNMSSGTHLPPKNTEFITVEKVSAFRLEPHENKGILTVDGERIENGSIQARILPGAVKVMVPNNDVLKDS